MTLIERQDDAAFDPWAAVEAEEREEAAPQPGGEVARLDTRPLKFRWLDDLDRSGLPSAQRDVLRRIGYHAGEDGTGSHPSYEQIGEELGGKTARSVSRALNGDPSRGWVPVVGVWVEHMNGANRPRGHAYEYRLQDRREREAATS